LSLVTALIVEAPVASSSFLLAAPKEPKKEFVYPEEIDLE